MSDEEFFAALDQAVDDHATAAKWSMGRAGASIVLGRSHLAHLEKWKRGNCTLVFTDGPEEEPDVYVYDPVTGEWDR